MPPAHAPCYFCRGGCAPYFCRDGCLTVCWHLGATAFFLTSVCAPSIENSWICPWKQWRHPKICVGGIEGAKCDYEGKKIPKLAANGWFWPFFSSNGKASGGRASEGGKCPHAPLPWCCHCLETLWYVPLHPNSLSSPLKIGLLLMPTYVQHWDQLQPIWQDADASETLWCSSGYVHVTCDYRHRTLTVHYWWPVMGEKMIKLRQN